MGVVRAILWTIPPVASGCLVLAYRLGPQLPKACRRTGNYLGLCYRLFKLIIVAMKPAQDSGEMLHLWSKSNVHFKAFARESRLNYMDLRMNLRKAVPSELTNDPFERFRLAQDAPECLPKLPTGAEIVHSVRKEQLRRELKLQRLTVEKQFREQV